MRRMRRLDTPRVRAERPVRGGGGRGGGYVARGGGRGIRDVGEILFALIFSAAFFEQPVSAPDAIQCMVADGQIEFTDETACAESGKRVSQGDELLLQRGRRFAGLPMRGAGDFQQAAGTLLLIAAEPLANRGH